MENMYVTSRGSRSVWHLTADAEKCLSYCLTHQVVTPLIILLLLLLLFSSPVKILKNNCPDGKSLIISETESNEDMGSETE